MKNQNKVLLDCSLKVLYDFELIYP